MKILFLGKKTIYAPGGTETFSKKIMEHIGQEHQYYEIFFQDDKIEYENTLNIQSHKMKYSTKKEITLGILSCIFKKGGLYKKVQKLIKEIDPDVIVNNVDFEAVGRLLTKKQLERIPVITQQHYTPRKYLNPTISKKILSIFSNWKLKYSYLVAFTEKSKKEFDKKIKFQKIFICPLTSDKRDKMMNKTKDIIYVGRLEKEKNISLLNETFENLPDLKKTIIGDGSEFNNINLNMKNLNYINRLENKKVLDEISKHKLLILTSNYEGFSYVSIESLNVGTPLIIRNTFLDADSIVNNSNGVIYSPDIKGKEIAELVKSNINIFETPKYKKYFDENDDFSNVHGKKLWNNIFKEVINDKANK